MQSTFFSSHILAIPWIFWPISKRADPWPLQNIILKFRVIISSITLGTQTRYSAYINIHCNYSAMIYPHNNVTLIKQLLNFNLSYKVLFFGGQIDTQNSFHKTLGITLMPNVIKIHSTYAMLIHAAESPDTCTSLEALWPKISHYPKSKEGILVIAFQSTVVPIYTTWYIILKPYI